MRVNSTDKKKILLVNGSASARSANGVLLKHIAVLMKDFTISFLPELKGLPPFDAELSVDHPPAAILRVREDIRKADAVIICTPEYVFSLPSGLKNMMEWCVATTVFQQKPVGLITAAAHGAEAHKQLKRIMQTLMAICTPATTLLIPGIKGKVSWEGGRIDETTKETLRQFVSAVTIVIMNNSNQ